MTEMGHSRSILPIPCHVRLAPVATQSGRQRHGRSVPERESCTASKVVIRVPPRRERKRWATLRRWMHRAASFGLLD
jgi:hypothetical protein